jgi:hypothetical protein
LNNYAEQAAVLEDEGHQHSHSHDDDGDDDDGCGVSSSGDDGRNDGSHADDDDDLNRNDNVSVDDGAMLIHRPSECFDDSSNRQQSMMESSTDKSNVITTDIIIKNSNKNNNNNNITSNNITITNDNYDDNNNNSSSSSSSSSIIDGDIINRQHTNTILYYCACLVGTMPGTLYLTSTNILLSSSTVTIFFSSILRPKREVFSLTSLYRTSLPTSRLKRQQQHASVDSSSSSNSYSPSPSSSISTSAIKSMLSSNTLTLTFQEDGSRCFVDVFISPLVIDCAKLQMIIMEVKSAFHSVSTDIDGF